MYDASLDGPLPCAKQRAGQGIPLNSWLLWIARRNYWAGPPWRVISIGLSARPGGGFSETVSRGGDGNNYCRGGLFFSGCALSRGEMGDGDRIPELQEFGLRPRITPQKNRPPLQGNRSHSPVLDVNIFRIWLTPAVNETIEEAGFATESFIFWAPAESWSPIFSNCESTFTNARPYRSLACAK